MAARSFRDIRFSMVFSMKRLSHYSLKRPVFKTQKKCVNRNTQRSGPVFSALSFPVPCNHSCSSGVAFLNVRSFPRTVFRRITQIVITALNGMFIRWARPHVLIEVYERMPPSLTYFYSATSIVAINFTVRIVTALKHPSPYAIFRRARHSVCYLTASLLACARFKGTMLFSQVVHLRNRLNYLVRPAESFTRLFGLSYCNI